MDYAGPVNVIIYLRVSTPQQAASGLGLAAQEQRCRDFCRARGWFVLAVHQDLAVSGAVSYIKRKGLYEAVNKLSKQVVLVASHRDRLARTAKGFDELNTAVGFRNSAIYTVDVADPDDVVLTAVTRMRELFAQYELDSIKERVSAAMKQLALQGRYTGGRVPYGYRLEEGGRLVVEEAEQVALQAIRELRARGLSLRKVAAVLEERGMLTREGRRWSASAMLNVEAGRLIEGRVDAEAKMLIRELRQDGMSFDEIEDGLASRRTQPIQLSLF
jgi:DNA invertase Pin-like site-specific DNA recombinase